MSFLKWQGQPYQRERRGSYSDTLIDLLVSVAQGSTVDLLSTGALESAAFLYSSVLSSCKVSAPDWAGSALSSRFLAQVGRDLVRVGSSYHLIEIQEGALKLFPCSGVHWEAGTYDPQTWTGTADLSGPVTTMQKRVQYGEIVEFLWGTDSGQPWCGRGPVSYAATSHRLHAENDRSLADESAGPIANLVPTSGNPAPAHDDPGRDDTDPFRKLRADIARTRGGAVLLQTSRELSMTPGSAPQKDWSANRLGPNPGKAQVDLQRQVFEQVVASCGIPPALFSGGNSQGQREALRRWSMVVVQPFVARVAEELSLKLEEEIRLTPDPYGQDIVGRSRALQSMVTAGVNLPQAMALSGLMSAD